MKLSDDMKLGVGLLSMRIGVATVFLMWAIDRVLAYGHNSGMIKGYYGLEISQPVLTAIGIVQILIILGFIIGVFKLWTYGYILVAHTITTLASAKRLLPADMWTLGWEGFEKHQLLYYGSLPMLGACIALFLLRDKDTLLSLNR